MRMNDLNLKVTMSLISLFCVGCFNGISKIQSNDRYLKLSKQYKTTGTFERHIEIIYNSGTKHSEFDLDDRVIFNRLELIKKNKICFLEEYLNFQGNETISNKFFSNIYGRGRNRLEMIKKDIRYPVEVEALYSMTTILFEGSVIISPVLINKQTGQICNFDRSEMDKIYRVYGQWFKEMKSCKFTKLRWPLKNSYYKWLGEETIDDVEKLLKRSI